MSADHPEILKLPTPIRCKILERVNRFKVEIGLNGEIKYALRNCCVLVNFICSFSCFGICGGYREERGC